MMEYLFLTLKHYRMIKRTLQKFSGLYKQRGTISRAFKIYLLNPFKNFSL